MNRIYLFIYLFIIYLFIIIIVITIIILLNWIDHLIMRLIYESDLNSKFSSFWIDSIQCPSDTSAYTNLNRFYSFLTRLFWECKVYLAKVFLLCYSDKVESADKIPNVKGEIRFMYITHESRRSFFEGNRGRLSACMKLDPIAVF